MKAIGVVVDPRRTRIILPPALTSIAVILSPIAAIGLVVVMVAAAIVHVRRRESPVPPIVLAVPRRSHCRPRLRSALTHTGSQES